MDDKDVVTYNLDNENEVGTGLEVPASHFIEVSPSRLALGQNLPTLLGDIEKARNSLEIPTHRITELGTQLQGLTEPIQAFHETLANVVTPIHIGLETYKAWNESLTGQFDTLKQWNTSLGETILDTKKYYEGLVQPTNQAMTLLSDYAADSQLLARSVTSITDSLPTLSDALINLNSLNNIVDLTPRSTVRFGLESATLIDDLVTVESGIDAEFRFGELQLTETAHMSLTARLERVEDGQARMMKRLEKLDTIEELIRQGSHQLLPARVESYELDEKTSTLFLNGQSIDLGAGSKQEQLCKIFFGGMSDPSNKVHIEEIVEAYGEEVGPENIKKWYDRFYQAARHLNGKVAHILGVKGELFLRSEQYFWVNPELLETLSKG